MSELERTDAALKATLKSVTQKHRSLRPQRDNIQTLTPGQWKTAQSLCCLRFGEVADVRRYILSLVDHHEALEVVDELAERVRIWWTTASAAEKVRLRREPETTQEKTALRRAMKFLSSDGLHRWLEAQNLRKGMAPCSASLLEHASDPTSAAQGALVMCTKRKTKLQWLRRWRLRCRIRLGRIPGRAYMSDMEAQRKASEHAYTDDVGTLAGSKSDHPEDRSLGTKK